MGGFSFFLNQAILCLLALFTCLPTGIFLVNPQSRSKTRAYCIAYSVTYPMPVPFLMRSRSLSAVR